MDYRCKHMAFFWDLVGWPGTSLIVKEPTHLSLRVGHVVPGVVVCLLLCIMVGRVKKGATVIGASCCGALPA